jgi:hypothetical protein
MHMAQPVARFSAETSASTDLDGVFRWLIDRQGNPLRLVIEDLPALGRDSMIRLARPVTAARAVLCTLWVVEDLESGTCLLAGQLRFVAHPTRSGIRLTFSGRAAVAVTSGFLRRQADHAAHQLVELIARSIERPAAPGRFQVAI